MCTIVGGMVRWLARAAFSGYNSFRKWALGATKYASDAHCRFSGCLPAPRHSWPPEHSSPAPSLRRKAALTKLINLPI